MPLPTDPHRRQNLFEQLRYIFRTRVQVTSFIQALSIHGKYWSIKQVSPGDTELHNAVLRQYKSWSCEKGKWKTIKGFHHAENKL